MSYGEFSETTHTPAPDPTHRRGVFFSDLIVAKTLTLPLRGKLIHTNNLVADGIQDNFAY